MTKKSLIFCHDFVIFSVFRKSQVLLTRRRFLLNATAANKQALRQDRVTGGAPKIYLCEFERSTTNLFQCGPNEQDEDQKKVFSSKISTNSVYRLKILAIFHEFLSEDRKKRSSSQNFHEIRCESTKITKIRAVNTNLGVLGLDLHSNSPEPVNFFGAQFSLGEGGTIFVWGSTAPECPPGRPASESHLVLITTLQERFLLGKRSSNHVAKESPV